MITNFQGLKLSITSMKVYSVCIYLSLNFLDRGWANIALLITLFLCLLDFKKLRQYYNNFNSLFMIIILFSIWISLVGIYHGSPLNELDNYYRFLLLFPLISISVRSEQINIITVISSVFALGHLLNFTSVENIRYSGTSNNAITYATITSSMAILSAYKVLNEKNTKTMKVLLLISMTIFLYCFISTETRGPIIGLGIALGLMIFFSKKKMSLAIVAIIISSFFIVPNPVFERMKELKDINFNNPIENQYHSSRERVYYIHHGYNLLKDNAFIGVGPHNVETIMKDELESLNIKNIIARDHLHNDYLDISVKFGLPALFLLLLIYLILYKNASMGNKRLVLLVLISLMASQLTQSQFAHHQALSFLITLTYIIINSKEVKNKKKTFINNT
jgi:O-antigen ligase